MFTTYATSSTPAVTATRNSTDLPEIAQVFSVLEVEGSIALQEVDLLNDRRVMVTWAMDSGHHVWSVDSTTGEVLSAPREFLPGWEKGGDTITKILEVLAR